MKTYKYPSKKRFEAISPITGETFRKFETIDEAEAWSFAWSEKQNIAIELYEEGSMLGTVFPDGESEWF